MSLEYFQNLYVYQKERKYDKILNHVFLFKIAKYNKSVFQLEKQLGP